MKREDLKEFNLSDEQVQKIMDLHGADLERQKQSITTLTAERDAAREQLGEANKKLEGYDPDWKQKAADAQKAADDKVKALQADHAAETAAAGLKFSSTSAKKAFLADLKAKGLALQDDGKLLGFDDFVKEYKGTDPNAFAPDKPAPTVTVPGQGRAQPKTGQAYVDDKYKHNPFYHPKGE